MKASTPILLALVLLGLTLGFVVLTLSPSYAQSSNQTATKSNATFPVYGVVNRTLVLFNNTVMPGNFVPSQISYSLGPIAYNPVNNEIYAAVVSSMTVKVMSAENYTVLKNIYVGPNPSAIAVDPNKGYVYVLNQGSGTVTVIAPNNTVLNVIETYNWPNLMTLDPNNGLVYVANSSTGQIIVLSPNSSKPVAQFKLNTSLTTIFYNPAVDKLIAVYIQAAFGKTVVHLFSINPNTMKVVKYSSFTTAYSTGVNSIAVNSKSGMIYFLEGNLIQYVNAKNLSLVATLNVGPVYVPYMSVWNPVNGLIYAIGVGANNARVLYVISPGNHTLLAKVPLPQSNLNGLAVNPVTGYVYITAGPPNPLYVVFPPDNFVMGVFVGQLTPGGMVYDSVNNYIFVTLTTANSVAVIDASTMKIVKFINTGLLPQGISIVPSNGMIYVANFRNFTLSAINPATLNTTAVIPVGKGPTSMAYNPFNGYLYVANYQSDTVSVVNVKTGQLVMNIQAGLGPNGIVFSPATKMVYVSNYVSKSIWVINASSNQVVDTINLNFNPTFLTLGNDNVTLIVGGPNQLLLIKANNVSSQRAISLPANPTSVVYDPVNGLYYVSLSNNVVLALNSTNFQTVGKLAVGANPVFLAVNTKNGNVYVANQNSGTISEISVTPPKTVKTGATNATTTTSSTTTTTTSTSSSTTSSALPVVTTPTGGVNFTQVIIVIVVLAVVGFAILVLRGRMIGR